METSALEETDQQTIFIVLRKRCLNFNNLLKDAQSNGDPVLAQNYLQHADHYLRRYNELNERKENFTDKSKVVDKKVLEENIEKIYLKLLISFLSQFRQSKINFNSFNFKLFTRSPLSIFQMEV